MQLFSAAPYPTLLQSSLPADPVKRRGCHPGSFVATEGQGLGQGRIPDIDNDVLLTIVKGMYMGGLWMHDLTEAEGAVD